MITHYLGNEEARGYARDFLERLHGLEAMPMVWCPITKSGSALVQAIGDIPQVLESYPSLADIHVVPIGVNEDPLAIEFRESDPATVLRNQNVLLLDGAIHSGKMMRASATEVLKHEPASLTSFALMTKRGSCFIPTFWGVMIEETDRAFFLLPSIPNNRLDATGDDVKRKQPSVHLERLTEEMATTLPPMKTGLDSMDRVTWGDRFFCHAHD